MRMSHDADKRCEMRDAKRMREARYATGDMRCEIRDARGEVRDRTLPLCYFLLSSIPYLVSRIPHLASSICVISIGLWPSSAFAHEQGGAAAGFLAGLAHPISGLDHVFAMIAVGLWGAQLGTPAVFMLPLVFPMIMAGGGALGLIGIPLPGIEIGIAVSAVVIGALVLASAKPRLSLALTIVGFFAIFHGHAHGTELPPGQSGLFYSMGFVIATGLLHGFGILIGLIHHWPIGRAALRAAGALVSVAGLVFLWRAVS